MVARIQGVANQQRKHAVITISVLVDETGTPLCWTEPSMTRLEPQSKTEKATIAMRDNPNIIEAMS